MFYHEITVWTRGIIMDKEARDVANALAGAARLEGRFTQFVSDYVDAPDRTNCLIRKYARMSDREIEDRFIYENPHPDVVVLVEETLIKAVNYLRGTPEGQGVLIVNSRRDPDYLLRFVPHPERLRKFVVVDATNLAQRPWMYIKLGDLGLDRLSTEGAAELKQIGIGVAAPLIGAAAAATGIVKLESLDTIVGDVQAMRAGADQHKVIDLAASRQPSGARG
jgi:oxalate oxidoreductase subunit delta